MYLPKIYQNKDTVKMCKKDNQTTTNNEPTEYGIVQDLLACSRHQGRKVYKVKWKDCSKTTWEPDDNIPEFLIREFHVNKTQSGKMKKKHNRH